MRLAAIALAIAALGVAAPAGAAICPAEAALRADPRWRDRDCELCVINQVYVGPGVGLRWNGAAVTLPTVNRYLTILNRMNPVPYVQLIVRRGADCAMIGRVRATIEHALPCEPGYHCPFALVDERSLPPPFPAPRRRRH
jgi:hypothetical protein